jgi:hypothetical protein
LGQDTFEVKRRELEREAESEKMQRREAFTRFKAFVAESIVGLERFAAEAETADVLGAWIPPEAVAKLTASLDDSPDDT